MAVWAYMPASDRIQEPDRYYCDNCISRGCSCNTMPPENCAIKDLDSVEWVEQKDELGRLLPCCEYEYDVKGFEECA